MLLIQYEMMVIVTFNASDNIGLPINNDNNQKVNPIVKILALLN